MARCSNRSSHSALRVQHARDLRLASCGAAGAPVGAATTGVAAAAAAILHLRRRHDLPLCAGRQLRQHVSCWHGVRPRRDDGPERRLRLGCSRQRGRHVQLHQRRQSPERAAQPRVARRTVRHDELERDDVRRYEHELRPRVRVQGSSVATFATGAASIAAGSARKPVLLLRVCGVWCERPPRACPP